MAFNFTNAPGNGTTYLPLDPNGGQTLGMYTYLTAKGAWIRYAGTAQDYNRIVNPAMQISQENGNTAGTANGYYAADQWLITKSVGLTATYSFQRVQVATPNGSPNRLRVTITAAQASLAANDWLGVVQRIEGNRVADFNWGPPGTGAKFAVLRFGFKGPAGTYGVCLRNGTQDRNYMMAVVTPDANEHEYSFSIPWDISGTFATDNTAGLELWFTLAAGSSLISGNPNTVWRSNGGVGVTGNTNGVAINGSVFEIFDVGLYTDPNLTANAPPFQCQPLAVDLKECQRYFYRAYKLIGIATSGTTINIAQCNHPVPMRAQPTISFVGTIRTYDGAAVPPVTAVADNGTNAQRVQVILTASGGGLTTGRFAYTLIDGSEANYIWVGARM